ncbi:phage tail protein [Salmonella enterica]
MGKLTETTQWEDDIYQLETSDPVLGGPDGVSNKPQKQLANRTQWLKQQLETTNSALANHAKSRNHPDASLTAKGFVQLYSGVMSDSEILAATPKAVKIAMDNANARLAKNQNLADLTSVPLARQSLQLGNSATLNTGTTTGTVAAGDDSRITGAMQKDQNGADIPDKPLFIENLGLKETLNPTKRVSIGNTGTGAFDGSTPCINIGDSDSGFIGSADGVIDIYCNNGRVGYIDGNGLHMLTDIHFDNARMTTNGDIFSSVWGNNWLSIWITNQLNTRGTIDWINNQLAIRDNNINARATIDYVNQTFARKNTASLAVNGWFRDESTGWIFQWGITPFSGNTTITVSLPIPFPNQGFLALGGPADALWYGEDDNSSYASLLNNSQLKVTTDTNVGTAWIALGR